MKGRIVLSCAAAILTGCATTTTAPLDKPVSIQAVKSNSSQSLQIATEAVALLKTKVSLDTPLEFKPVGGLGTVLAFKLREAGYSVSTNSVSGSVPVSYTLDSLDSMRLFVLRAGNYHINRVYKTSGNNKLTLVSTSARASKFQPRNIFESNPVAPTRIVSAKPKKTIKRKKITNPKVKPSLIVKTMTNKVVALERELLALQKSKVEKITPKPRIKVVKKPVKVAKARKPVKVAKARKSVKVAKARKPVRVAVKKRVVTKRPAVKKPVRVVAKRPAVKRPARVVAKRPAVKKPVRVAVKTVKKTSVMPKKVFVNVNHLINPASRPKAIFNKTEMAFIEKLTNKSLPVEKERGSGKYFLQLIASNNKQVLLRNQKLVSSKGYQSMVVNKSGLGLLRIYSNSYKELTDIKSVFIKRYDDSYIKRVTA